MKKLFQFLLLVLVVSQYTGCKKDNSNNLPTDTNVTATIIGQVLDEAGIPVQGVQISTGTYSKTTNTYGEFVFEKTSVPSKRFYIKASKIGYMPAGAGGIAKNGSVAYIKIKLMALGAAQNLVVSTGATITADNGAKIVFPAMALSYKDGGVFTGTATVYARYISPATTNFSELVPGGDLTALSNNAIAALYSYGMLGVRLEDAQGTELRVADAMQTEVRMPIASFQLSAAPATIPLLTFDEEKGLWIEEGTATKTGNEYIGNVSHFSWWNCDLIYNPPTVISGRVVDCNGSPMPGVRVSFNNQNTLMTDNNGNYSNYVPVGIQVSVSVNAVLNSNMYATLQPVVLTTVSGTNQVQDLVLSCPANISGQLKDCNGQPTSAYIRVVYSSGYSTLFLSADGSFNIPVQMFSSFSVRIFNGQATIDTTATSAGAGSNVNTGTFTLCSSNGGSCSDGATSVTDIDGNVYQVVSIGSQCWLLENLKTAKYRNGDPIPNGLNDAQWTAANTGAYSYYNNDSTYNSQYGKLYNWYAATDARNIAPVGWHVATDADWDQLLNYLGGGAVAGGKLKSTGTIQAASGIWETPNTAADNSTGFYGLPAGYRSYDGTYSGLGSYGYWFTATASSPTNAWFYLVNNIAANAYRNDNDQRIGLSVRCVKD